MAQADDGPPKNMYDQWADLYDSVYSYVVDDIPFYVQEARGAAGRVLELGCGTGRIAIPIVQAGVDLVGLDSSGPMLDIARRKVRELGQFDGSLALVRGDMRDFPFGTLFDLVIIPFRGFLALLTVADQVRTLAQIRRHLAPGGKLIFNIFVPDPEMLVQDRDVPYHLRDVTDPDTGTRYVLYQQSQYDHYNQIVSTRTIVDELDDDAAVRRRVYRDFQLRYAHHWEVHHLLRLCGFEAVDLWGDFAGTPFDGSSTEMVWVAIGE